MTCHCAAVAHAAFLPSAYRQFKPRVPVGKVFFEGVVARILRALCSHFANGHSKPQSPLLWGAAFGGGGGGIVGDYYFYTAFFYWRHERVALAMHCVLEIEK